MEPSLYNAQRTAGTIQSDIERGFKRGEVAHYNDLIVAGSIVEATMRGTVRIEGKTYVVREGDIMNVLFNV